MKYYLILWLNNRTREKFYFDSEKERDKWFNILREYGVKPEGYAIAGETKLIPYWAISKIEKKDVDK